LNRQNCELRSSLGRLPGGLSFCSSAEKHFRAATAGAMLTSVPGEHGIGVWGISAGTSFHFALPQYSPD
jgi:hypothetical protein